MTLKTIEIKFDSCNRGEWIRKISTSQAMLSNLTDNDKIVIHISPEIDSDKLEPLHLVTLACLIQHIYDQNAHVSLSRNKGEATDYIFNRLGFKHYWTGGLNHVDATGNENIFNLWRIVDSEKDLYARHVENYLKQNFFHGKDLSAISVCLIEAFYNVFDHAKANGNAFSLIKFDKETGILSVAIADFGRGIANSIRENFRDRLIKNDVDALKLSLENSITIKSTKHNKGLGLGNILSSVDKARIFTNYSFFIKSDNQTKFSQPKFPFPGTLIYFDVDLSNLDDEEILDTFNW